MTRADAKPRPDTDSLRAPEARRLYEQLEELLRVYVHEHGLRPGDRLPSERALAGALKVSRVSLRQATVSLEVQGLLEVRHGGGIYVRSLDVDPERLKTMLTRRRRLPEVLEAREAIECMLARLAAQRRTEADLAAIDDALRAMGADIAENGIGDAADRSFHAAIALASKNKLLSDVMAALADPIQETRLESLSEPGRPLRSFADHRRIAEAIRRQDPRAAETAMRRHLKIVSDIRLMRWTPGELDAAGGGAADDANGPRRD
ncbi:MAG TPA: FadR/GntR family transcriptional regulator [Solirubrobacteraceae bacterium]|jgi:GntR family transcriptional repressor for pyruvate dehydrogenase complex